MAQEILVKYRAEVDQLTNELKKVVAAQGEITKEQTEGNKQVQKNLTSQEFAAKKRLELLKNEEAQLAKLRQLRKLAFNPKDIAEYDKKIQEATRNIQTLGGKTKAALNDVSGSIKSIGLGIAASLGAAFSVSAIIDFSKASVNAFLEAEENASRLKFAITQISGESEAAYDRLIKQSEQLQGISIFSDDSIQQAQTALATFGLTSTQIEKLIPKIADFASATKKDIPEATSVFIRALEGQTRGLIEAGLKFDDTGTIMGNYNTLLDATGKLTGSTALATESLSGQLKQLENDADNLQETVGERLAPAFVKMKQAFFEGVLNLLDDFKRLGSGDFSQLFVRDAKVIQTTTEQIGAKIEERIKQNRELGLSQAEASRDAVNSLREELLVNIEVSSEQLKKALLVQDIEPKLLKIYKDRLQVTRDELTVFQQTVQQRKDQQNSLDAEQKRALTSQLLQNKSISELNILLKANAALSDVISKDNATLINKELEARKKLNELAGKAQAKALEDRQAAEQKAWEEFKKQLEKEQDELLGIINRAEDKIKDKDSLFEFQIRFKASAEGEDAAFNEAREKLFKIYEEEQIRADVTSNTVEEANAKKQKAYEEYIKNLESLVGGFAIFEEAKTKEIADNEVNIFFKKNAEIFDAAENLANSLQSLYAQQTDNRIAEIESIRDAEIASLDLQEESLNDNLAKRRISETDANILSEQLEKKRAAAEKKALAESNRLKKKQFNIDKAAAVIKIAIDTARAVAAALAEIAYPANIAVAALIGAAGLAQEAFVLGQPNPYRKGTKSAKEGLARVGEEGEEITYLASGTKVLPHGRVKTYGEVLDKMFDGTFDKHYMKREMAPSLNNQVKKHEKSKQQSFASNIAESMVMNATGMSAYEYSQIHKKGQPITNVDAIGRAVASHLKQDIYRR